MLNKIMLQGNLTADPELKYMQSGTALCTASIATSETRIVNGNKVVETLFIDLNIWGSLGERFNQYFRKGNEVIISGKLLLQTWNDQQGNNRRKHLINVNEWHFTRNGTKQQEYDYSGNQDQQNHYQDNRNIRNNENNQFNKPEDIPEIDIDEDEIPF